MRGDAKVIDVLNGVLCNELTAVNQYFIHAKMCADWGYQELAAYTRAESIDEMRHAEICIDRILYLGGVPNMQKYKKIDVGGTVPEQFQLDLAVEEDAVTYLREGIEICLAAGDHTTRQILDKILAEEEHHIDWLATQLDLIGNVGLENYLATKLGATDAGH